MRTIRSTANSTQSSPPRLLDRRLVFLLGKGGVGRSTIAAALGVLAARGGRRAIVVEVSGRGDVPRLFGRRVELGVELELAPGLWTLDVDPRVALEEYLHDQLPLRLLADAIGSSTTFGYVAAVTPGLRELLTIGKVWELAQPQRRTKDAQEYDVVIVDAPATGHGLALLQSPHAFARAASVGPIARQGRLIAETLADRRQTALAAVATPESAAVEELLELRSALTQPLDAVIANAVVPERFSAADALALRGARMRAQLDSPLRDALSVAIDEETLARAQRAQLKRLGRTAVTLPLISTDISAGELGRLADGLAVLA
ncbi:MAG TPA: ArsA family ATPase [Solirubrobacteraceae bacterium]